MSAAAKAVYYSPIADYSSESVNEIFGTKNKFAKWVQVWQAQIKVLVDMGVAEQKAYDEISSVIVDDALVKKFQEYERITHHDINAGIKYLGELCPIASEYIHAGMTSMDVDDNGRVLQQRDALYYVLNKIKDLDLESIVLKGKKVSGAIGTSQDLSAYLQGNDRAQEFSKRIMDELGVPFFERTTQIYPREQDLKLASYLIKIAKRLTKDKGVADDLFGLMIARRDALSLDSAYDIDHRTIADSVVRRIEIPELFMLLDGIINRVTGAPYEKSGWVDPLSRYASKDLMTLVSYDYSLEESLAIIKKGLINSIDSLSKKVEEYKDVVYLARTHVQPAQLTTVGRFLGLTLDKLVGYVEQIDKISTIDDAADIILEFGASFSTFCNTLVLKQSQRQWFEPFKSSQVGSSAMPYKKNPNKSERIIGLARMVIGRVNSIALSNSYAMDIELPELFLLADSMINSFNYLFTAEGGMKVNISAMNKEIDEYKPEVFQTELLQEAGKRGAVREQAHNELRDIMYVGGGIKDIKKSKFFKELFGQEHKRFKKLRGKKELKSFIKDFFSRDNLEFVGTSLEDVDASLANAQPIIDKYASLIGGGAKLSV